MKTYSLKKEEVERNWFVLDVSDRILGRVATKIADRIRGKDKPTFTPHTDGGDYVIVVNAEKIKVTGSKFTNKKYYKHSLYPGGLKTQTFQELNSKNPERIIEEAVKGMLPKNKLGKSMIKKLKHVSGQNPIEAAKLGCKIYHGPYVYNFEEIYEILKKNNIARKIEAIEDLSSNLIKDLESPLKKETKISNQIEILEQKTLEETMKNLNNFIK